MRRDLLIAVVGGIVAYMIICFIVGAFPALGPLAV